MKKLALFLILLLLCTACGCTGRAAAPVVATTRPVYDLTSALCEGTSIQVDLLISQSVSCLHDYSLSTAQMKTLENAALVVFSGAGLEAFDDELLLRCNATVDASDGVPLLSCHSGHETHHGHTHEADSHIWLAPENAKTMARNICAGLAVQFPAEAASLERNLQTLLAALDKLQCYGEERLRALSCRELITFHNGFAYLAQAFNLTILQAVEEESGSEASAQALIELIELVRSHDLPAVFSEVNGSASACGIISAETGVPTFMLSMGLGGGNYFDIMYQNIDTLKEALG